MGEVREMEVNMSGEWRVHGKRKQKRQEGQGNGVAENYSNSNSVIKGPVLIA